MAATDGAEDENVYITDQTSTIRGRIDLLFFPAMLLGTQRAYQLRPHI